MFFSTPRGACDAILKRFHRYSISFGQRQLSLLITMIDELSVNYPIQIEDFSNQRNETDGKHTQNVLTDGETRNQRFVA